MSTPTHLYMFAIMPPPELAAAIHLERVRFAQEYSFFKALKPPVHITLLPPFRTPSSQTDSFELRTTKIDSWAKRKTPFEIQLNNFDSFDNAEHPVLYINVIRSQQILELHASFLKELKSNFGMEPKKEPYRPHFTIAYRDTNTTIFPQIKSAYARMTFDGSFICDAIYLWKHDGKNWQVSKKFTFAPTQVQLSLF